MMPQYYDNNWNGHMAGGFGVIMLILWLVVFTDLVLFGIWLWKQINKK